MCQDAEVIVPPNMMDGEAVTKEEGQRENKVTSNFSKTAAPKICPEQSRSARSEGGCEPSSFRERVCPKNSNITVLEKLNRCKTERSHWALLPG
jgi:hypothetical protein